MDTSAQEPEQPTPLSAEGLERWLAPSLALGGDLGGACLTDVYPSGARDVGLTFERADGAIGRLLVAVDDPARPAFGRARGLAVSYPNEEGEARDLCVALARALLGRIASAPTPPRFTAPPPTPPSHAGRGPTAFNLVIPAPCGQKCSFCSMQVRSVVRADVDDAFVAGLARSLAAGRARGATVLRINGIEPLNAPYLFDLLAEARRLGYTAFKLFSACRPLADRALAERLAAAVPDDFTAYVPVHAATPALHDALAGAPGAFEQVLRAVAHLQALRRPGWQIQLTTVAMRQNLHELPALAALARDLGADGWGVHLPYPNTSRDDDAYFDVAVRMADLVAAAFPPGAPKVADLQVGKVPPCVMLAHQRATGHALITARSLDEAEPAMAGTMYRVMPILDSGNAAGDVASTTATSRCPHLANCALAPACPGGVYTLYKRRFGLDELAPASVDDLVALADGPAIVAWAEQAGARAASHVASGATSGANGRR